jgi:hypothetical protein
MDKPLIALRATGLKGATTRIISSGESSKLVHATTLEK